MSDRDKNVHVCKCGALVRGAKRHWWCDPKATAQRLKQFNREQAGQNYREVGER